MNTTHQAVEAAALPDTVAKALRTAFSLGQTYWQQADSEYISQHKRADVTRAKFQTLIDDTLSALTSQQEVAQHTLNYLQQRRLYEIGDKLDYEWSPEDLRSMRGELIDMSGICHNCAGCGQEGEFDGERTVGGQCSDCNGTGETKYRKTPANPTPEQGRAAS